MKLLPAYLAYAAALSGLLWRQGIRSASEHSTAAPSPKPTKVLIVGATGGTGRELVTQALERGCVVTALARSPSAIPLTHERLHVVKGDVLDYPSLETAMQGQDAVICALGHKQYFRPTRILSEGTRNILRAMNTNGVARLVCETALGIGSSAGRMGLYYTFFVIPIILPFYFWDKTRQEKAIAASRTDWVVVRPGALTNGPKRGSYRHGSGIGNFLWTARISRADVADFMLNQLTDNTYLQNAPGVSW
jgi:putative NADH-flavin reductase